MSSQFFCGNKTAVRTTFSPTAEYTVRDFNRAGFANTSVETGKFALNYQNGTVNPNNSITYNGNIIRTSLHLVTGSIVNGVQKYKIPGTTALTIASCRDPFFN